MNEEEQRFNSGRVNLGVRQIIIAKGAHTVLRDFSKGLVRYFEVQLRLQTTEYD